MFFQKTTWRLLWRVALKKDGLVLRLQKYEGRSINKLQNSVILLVFQI